MVLICCILVNASPIRARATSIFAGMTLGELLVILCGLAGIVFHEPLADAYSALEASFNQFISNASETVRNEVAEIKQVIAIFPYPGNFPDAPADGSRKSTTIKLSRVVLAAISAWIASVIAKGGVEIEGEEAPVNYAFYGDYLLPEPPDFDRETYKYCWVQAQSPFTYLQFFASTVPPFVFFRHQIYTFRRNL